MHRDLRSLVPNPCKALLRPSLTARTGICYQFLPASAYGVLRRCWRSCASTCRPPMRSTGAPAPPADTRGAATAVPVRVQTHVAFSDSRAIGTGKDSGVPACGVRGHSMWELCSGCSRATCRGALWPKLIWRQHKRCFPSMVLIVSLCFCGAGRLQAEEQRHRGGPVAV